VLTHASGASQAVVGRQGDMQLTNEAGEVTRWAPSVLPKHALSPLTASPRCSHLQGMFTRTVRILDAGIKPMCVRQLGGPQ